LGRATTILLARDEELTLRAAWPPEDALDTASMTAARWAFTHDETAGTDTSTLPTVPWFFLPLRTSRGPIGVVGIAKATSNAPLDSEARALLDTLAEQTAAALERASLARETVEARAAAETERVRNTLLASISHDFRTPLSSILGSATSLIDYGEKLDAAAQKDLLGHIKQETEHLDGMVRNLLAMTRIDAGALELRRDWVDLREIAERVVSAARRRGAAQHLEMKLPAHLPLVRADATLVEQALGNVIGNAIAHTPNETHVVIDAAVTPENITLRISDDGPGIPSETLPHVFEKFVCAPQMESSSADGGKGTGLGLAIAKGIMDAHGGSITAESPIAAGRGTTILLTFPREETAT
jgi:two-component system, OmpR family, sensor histidine kinase KdpD